MLRSLVILTQAVNQMVDYKIILHAVTENWYFYFMNSHEPHTGDNETT